MTKRYDTQLPSNEECFTKCGCGADKNPGAWACVPCTVLKWRRGEATPVEVIEAFPSTTRNKILDNIEDTVRDAPHHELLDTSHAEEFVQALFEHIRSVWARS